MPIYCQSGIWLHHTNIGRPAAHRTRPCTEFPKAREALHPLHIRSGQPWRQSGSRESVFTVLWGMRMRAPASDMPVYCCAHNCSSYILCYMNEQIIHIYVLCNISESAQFDSIFWPSCTGNEIDLAPRYTYLHEGSACSLGTNDMR